jgi:hypothetical protein
LNTTVVIALFAIIIAIGFATAFAWRVGRERAVRQALIGLIGKREEVLAAHRALLSIGARLSQASDEDLEHYAFDPRDEDRKALVELGNRMRLFAEDLWHAAYPERVSDIVRRMGETATLIAEESLRVSSASADLDALDALGELDLTTVSDAVDRMEATLKPLLSAYAIDDPSVYGGGMYI